MNTTAGEFRYTTEKVILDAEHFTPNQIFNLAPLIGSLVYAIKIGYSADLPDAQFIEKLKKAGFNRVWLDHNVITSPETAGLYAYMAKNAGADILSVYAAGGAAMMRAVVENGPKEIMATTLLATHNEEDVRDIHGNAPDLAARSLASIAKQAGVHGLVCPNRWIGSLATGEFKKLKLVSSRIIPPYKKTSLLPEYSPRSAIINGASHLLISAPLIDQVDPRATFDLIETEVSAARREQIGIKVLKEND